MDVEHPSQELRVLGVRAKRSSNFGPCPHCGARFQVSIRSLLLWMVGPLCFVLIPIVIDVGVIWMCVCLLCALVLGELCRRRAKMYVLQDYTKPRG